MLISVFIQRLLYAMTLMSLKTETHNGMTKKKNPTKPCNLKNTPSVRISKSMETCPVMSTSCIN